MLLYPVFCILFPMLDITFFDDGLSTAEPLFLLHALGAESSIWDEVVDRLATERRIVRVDLPGHGRSAASAQAYTIDELLDAILARAAGTGTQQFSLGGISIGGLIAQAMAIRHPDKINRLILSNTAARIGTEQIWTERERRVLEVGLSTLAPELARRWLSPSYVEQHPEVLDRLTTQLGATSVTGYLHAVALLRDTDLRNDIARITSPTLIIHGERDPVISRDETAVLETIRGSRTEVLDCAHLSCVERPDEFATCLATFLSSVSP
jgi:3-oxoadipate enol-lactonase